MDSLESKLGEILSSPEKMEQVMKIAGELLGSGSAGGAANAPTSAPTGSMSTNGEPTSGAPNLSAALPSIASMLGSGAAQSEPPKAEQSAPAGGFGDLLGGLGGRGDLAGHGGLAGHAGLAGLDPRFMSAAMQVLGALGRDDDSTRLLRALRPHLRTERCERLDRAVQILRISGAIRAAIHSFSGGAGDVQQI